MRPFSKGDGDDLLKNLGQDEDTSWTDALASPELDAETATAVAQAAGPKEAVAELVSLLVAARRERDETVFLARQFRQDVEHAEAEVRRLEKETTDLGREREQVALDAVSQKAGRAEEQVRHGAMMQTLKREHEGEIATLHQAHEEALAARAAEQAAAVRTVDGELTAARAELERLTGRLRAHESKVASLEAAGAEIRECADQARAIALKSLETRLAEEGGHALAAQQAEWEARLDRLRRDHADALSAVTRRHAEEMAAQRQAHEEALAIRDSEQFAALRRASDERWSRMQQAQDELRGQYDSKLAEALAQQNLAREKAEQELAEVRQQHESQVSEVLAQQNVGRERAERDLAEVRQQHESQLSELVAKHNEGRLQAERDQTEALGAQEAILEAEKAQALSAQKAEWEAKLERLHREQAEALALLGDEHRNELSLLRHSHEAALATAAKEQEAALGRATEEAAAVKVKLQRRLDEAERFYGPKLAELQAGHDEARRKLEQETAARKAAEARLREDKAQAMAELQAEWEAKVEKLRRAHGQVLAALQEEQQRQSAAPSVPEAGTRAERLHLVPEPAGRPERPATPAVPHAVEPPVPPREVERHPVPTPTAEHRTVRPPQPPAPAVPRPRQEPRAAVQSQTLVPPPTPTSPPAPVPAATKRGDVVVLPGTSPGAKALLSLAGRLPSRYVLASAAGMLLVLVLGAALWAVTRWAGHPAADATRTSAGAAGGLTVETEPAGATVIVNGDPRGVTPLHLTGLPLGAYDLELVLAGHESKSIGVTLSAATPQSVVKEALTTAATGQVDIESTPSGAAVTLGGSPAGQTPVTNLEVRAGTHPLGIVKEGYSPWSGTLTVEAGKKVQVRARLVPAQSAPGGIYEAQDVDAPPRQVSGEAAAYPEKAPPLGPGQALSVTVSFVVDEAGRAGGVEVTESAGGVLDRAVTTAVSTWRFTPGMKNGQKVKVRLSRKFKFQG